MKIQLSLDEKELKLFLLTLKFHEDGSLKMKLKFINDTIEYIKSGGYTGEERKEMIEYCNSVLSEVNDCSEVFKKIKTSGTDEFEVTRGEKAEFLKFLVEQTYHAKERIQDFTGDRFGWGLDNCKTLIDQENQYIEVLQKVFNMYRGRRTYKSILDGL